MAKNELPLDTIVEVRTKKDMPYGEYLKILHSVREKGWHIQAFQKK